MAVAYNYMLSSGDKEPELLAHTQQPAGVEDGSNPGAITGVFLSTSTVYVYSGTGVIRDINRTGSVWEVHLDLTPP